MGVRLLTELLRSLTAEERREAALWLASPLHNRREDVRSMFNLLLRNPASSREVVFAELYPGSPFSDVRYRQVAHQLLRRLEDYLRWHHGRERHTLPDLLDLYRKRGLEAHYATRLRRHRPPTPASIADYRTAYSIARHRDWLAVRGDARDATPERSTEEALAHYVLLLWLREATAALTQPTLPLRARQKIEREAEHRPAPTTFDPDLHPLPFCYLTALHLQLRIGATSLDDLTTALTRYGNALGREERRDLLLLAINYGLRAANGGDESALPLTLDLYRYGLDSGVLYDRGRLSRFSFNNIVALYLRQQKIALARSFVAEQRDRLEEVHREEIIALAEARLAYAEGKDGQVLEHLQRADFRDFIHHMTARVLQLKVYFRQEEDRLLSAHLSSTSRLLRRRTKVTYHLENYRNIFRLARAILRLPPGRSREREELRRRIGAAQPCTERAWLLEYVG